MTAEAARTKPARPAVGQPGRLVAPDRVPDPATGAALAAALDVYADKPAPMITAPPVTAPPTPWPKSPTGPWP